MSAINDLRSLARRLETALHAAIAEPGDANRLERARGLATLALELAGGSGSATPGPTPQTWELDTMTETELTLAFVLGSIERAARQPERSPHLLRDAVPRIEAVRLNLDRPRSR